MLDVSSKAIRSIQFALHACFSALIIVSLIRRAIFSLPDDWLFFLSSSAMENFVSASIAYTLHFIIVKRRGYWKKIAFGVFAIILLLALAATKDHRIHFTITINRTFEYFTSFLGLSLLFYLLIFMVDRFDIFNRHQQMEKELIKAREQLLRNQLNPHFLFNAFNSLYSLSLKNHPETSDYILKLSAMMRYLTDETHLEKVPLYKELDFIEKYVAIEKIRFGNDARIRFHTGEYIKNNTWIEPFILITLVENAFKHGFYTNIKEAFVSIEVQVDNGTLFCKVENSRSVKQHFHDEPRHGKGLENLTKRLDLLYPNKSDLKNTSTPSIYSAHLKIILN